MGNRTFQFYIGYKISDRFRQKIQQEMITELGYPGTQQITDFQIAPDETRIKVYMSRGDEDEEEFTQVADGFKTYLVENAIDYENITN